MSAVNYGDEAVALGFRFILGVGDRFTLALATDHFYSPPFLDLEIASVLLVGEHGALPVTILLSASPSNSVCALLQSGRDQQCPED